MNLDPLLMEILTCPCVHHAPLQAKPDEVGPDGVLVCTRCLTSFPVRNDIAVMVLDEATPGPGGVGAPANPPPAAG